MVKCQYVNKTQTKNVGAFFVLLVVWLCLLFVILVLLRYFVAGVGRTQQTTTKRETDDR